MIASMLERPTAHCELVEIPIAGARLTGNLTMPVAARGLIVVASGDGERLYSRGNEAIAAELVRAGFGTLVVEVLTPEEVVEDAESSELRFNQTLVAARVVRIVSWVRSQLAFVGLEIGCLAGGLCAGSVIAAAAVMPAVRSILCRGARFELAEALLDRVHAPVLLIVGQRDAAHLAANRRALSRLPRTSLLRVVNDARHLLDEPRELECVGREAVAWFGRTLPRGQRLQTRVLAARV
jgi:putative phosphoribosyl transferase